MAPVPRQLLYGFGAIFTGFVVFGSLIDFKTPGVKALEERHTAAGAAPHGTPARGTKLGDPSVAVGDQEKVKTPDSAHFQENFGDQKPQNSELNKKWNRTQYGGDSGKTT